MATDECTIQTEKTLLSLKNRMCILHDYYCRWAVIPLVHVTVQQLPAAHLTIGQLSLALDSWTLQTALHLQGHKALCLHLRSLLCH